MTEPAAVNEMASRWLERQVSDVWTAQDQSELDAWLAQSSAHRAAYWRLEDAWQQASRLSALRRPDAPSSTRSGPLRFLVRTAAVVTVCVATGFVGYHFVSAPQTRSYATILGGRSTLKLADGSRIDLNTNTLLRVAASGEARTVWLEKGEAYFQIVHNADRPFTVYANGHRITDLGTKFLVRQEKGRLEVALMEGRARVDTGNGPSSHSAILNPGEIAVTTGNQLSVSANQSQKLNNELGWRQGQLIFAETTLAEAAAEFNRYNTNKLIVRDPAVAQLKINGTFPTSGAEMFARVAQHILQLRTSRRGDDIVISR